jgi:serine/threonine protein kinase
MSKHALLPKLRPGHRIREYEVITQISEGGQGRVYLCRFWSADLPPIEQIAARMQQPLTPAQVTLYRLCVVKVPHPPSADNIYDEHKFLSHPKIAHPRIIQLYQPPSGSEPRPAKRKVGLCFGSFTADDGTTYADLPCLVLNYEPGGSLRDLMRRHHDEALPPGVAVEIAHQVAEALHYLHTETKLAHHDISPSNIVLRQPLPWLIPAKPDCVLVDLAASDSFEFPRVREILAQPRYRAPERQGGGQRPVPMPDIYSLGIVMYELLAGRAALPTGRVTDAAGRKMPAPLPRLDEKAPDLSAQLVDLVMAMVSFDPAKRPSAAEVMRRLDATPERKLPATLRGPRPPRAPQWIAASIVLVLLLVGGLSFGMIAQANPPAVASPTPTIRVTVTPFPSATPTPAVLAPTVPPTSTPARAP